MSIKDAASNPRDDLNKIPIRTTYTPRNAEDFRETFDIMIQTNENKFIDANKAGLKVSSLYIKAQDALRWLADNYQGSDKYAILRTRVSISKLQDGILIKFKPSVRNLIASAISAPPSTEVPKAWKEELVKWLENAQSGELFVKEGIYISDTDRVWLNNLLCNLDGCEADIASTHVRICR